jgi:hypothetical protein
MGESNTERVSRLKAKWRLLLGKIRFKWIYILHVDSWNFELGGDTMYYFTNYRQGMDICQELTKNGRSAGLRAIKLFKKGDLSWILNKTGGVA